MLVDRSDSVFETAELINREVAREVSQPFAGDVTNETFRSQVYDDSEGSRRSRYHLCSRGRHHSAMAWAVRINKETGKAEPYSITTFRQVMEVNLVTPIYWAMEMGRSNRGRSS